MVSDPPVRAIRPRAALPAGLAVLPFLSALLVLYVLSNSASAQQPSIRPYQTEEDLWEALNDGEITFDDFLELLDLARSGADSLVIPPSDWEALPGSEAGYLVSPDSTENLNLEVVPSATRHARIPVSWSMRGGVDADLDNPTGSDGYSVLRFQGGRFRGILDWSHDDEDGGEWRRRTLVYRDRLLTAQLGTIEPRWGRGLVVGRRSRILSASDLDGSFAHPTRGRFNGIWLASNERRRFSAQALYSDLRNDAISERALAVDGVVYLGQFNLGVSALTGAVEFETSLPRYEEQVLGVHAQYGGGKRALLAEAAVDDHGASSKAVELVWPLSSGRFHARAWSNGAGFVNPWGGGPGHSDTRSIDLDSIDLTFASRIAGERGFDFTTSIAVAPQVNLRWDWMSHREEPGAALEHSGVFRAEIKRPSFRTTPFVRARVDEDETESFSLGNYLWIGPDHRELNVRLEFGTHYVDEVQFVRAGLGVKIQINRVVRLAPALRWTDPNLDIPADGYWYFYFTEVIVPISHARIEMALVWKKYEDSAKDDLVELRVRFVAN